jgi:hypothetical protein
MIELKLYDRQGAKLNFGDIVKVSGGHNFHFYSEVKYLPEEECITPFHTFTFHSFEKVDKVPDYAIKSMIEKRYDIWFANSPEPENLEGWIKGEKYLLSWREYERLFEQRCFRITVKP